MRESDLLKIEPSEQKIIDINRKSARDRETTESVCVSERARVEGEKREKESRERENKREGQREDASKRAVKMTQCSNRPSK